MGSKNYVLLRYAWQYKKSNTITCNCFFSLQVLHGLNLRNKKDGFCLLCLCSYFRCFYNNNVFYKWKSTKGAANYKGVAKHHSWAPLPKIPLRVRVACTDHIHNVKSSSYNLCCIFFHLLKTQCIVVSFTLNGTCFKKKVQWQLNSFIKTRKSDLTVLVQYPKYVRNETNYYTD